MHPTLFSNQKPHESIWKLFCSKPCNCDILVLNDLVQRREDVSPRTAQDDGQHVCDDDGCDGSQTLLYSSGCLTQIFKYGSFGETNEQFFKKKFLNVAVIWIHLRHLKIIAMPWYHLGEFWGANNFEPPNAQIVHLDQSWNRPAIEGGMFALQSISVLPLKMCVLKVYKYYIICTAFLCLLFANYKELQWFWPPLSAALLNPVKDHGAKLEKACKIQECLPESGSHCSPSSRTSSALQLNPARKEHCFILFHFFRTNDSPTCIFVPIKEQGNLFWHICALKTFCYFVTFSFFDVSTALRTSNWCWFLAKQTSEIPKLEG